MVFCLCTDWFGLVFLHFLNGKGTETLEEKAFPDFVAGSE